eukprot:gnl/Trimastix_PCT/200.p1 GENE.gnl/Trimastix_PCT/200~~gnl/Trimastix_PCT/200.p1  ORF type:complete len:248 (+),score=44.22 gnl/Trimastix_PCT/200:81-824(+)
MEGIDVLHPTDFLHDPLHPPSPPNLRRRRNSTIKTPAAGPSRPAIVFDWDDTLFPSTALRLHGLTVHDADRMPPAFRAQVQQLETKVIKLLETCVASADVYIITNAETGWVELSAEKYMPSVYSIVKNMNIVSARSTYEPMERDPINWKVRAFMDRVTESYGNAEKLNIISFGDSQNERHALLQVRHHCEQAKLTTSFTKSIKFVELPTIEQIRQQIEMILVNLNNLISHVGNLDLMLTIRPVGPSC